MILLDVEKGINNEKICSRFKLTYIASIRARDIYDNKEGTLPCLVNNEFVKNTTKALYEIIEGKIDFIDEPAED
jgi:DNA-directed RNA polymerase omega subunit